MMGKSCIIPGTRPEIIKMSRWCGRASGRRARTGLWCTLGREAWGADGSADGGSRPRREINGYKRTHLSRRITKSGV